MSLGSQLSKAGHIYVFRFHSKMLTNFPKPIFSMLTDPHQPPLPQGWRACWSQECRHACLPSSCACFWWHGWMSHNSGRASFEVESLSPSCCRSHGVCWKLSGLTSLSQSLRRQKEIKGFLKMLWEFVTQVYYKDEIKSCWPGNWDTPPIRKPWIPVLKGKEKATYSIISIRHVTADWLYPTYSCAFTGLSSKQWMRLYASPDKTHLQFQTRWCNHGSYNVWV